MTKRAKYFMIGIDEPNAVIHFLFYRTANMINQFILNTISDNAPAIKVFDDVINMVRFQFQAFVFNVLN